MNLNNMNKIKTYFVANHLKLINLLMLLFLAYQQKAILHEAERYKFLNILEDIQQDINYIKGYMNY
jgi:hypothetical protein